MPRFTSPLEQLRVAAPCRADWDEMVGDERVRFCQQCERNVYNISGMTRAEAENLVVKAEGRLCVRFYRRRDGTVLTANCPVGLRALKQRAARAARAFVSAALGFFAGLGVSPGPPARWISIVGADALPPPGSTRRPSDERVIMGDIAPVEAVEPVGGGYSMGTPAIFVGQPAAGRGKARRAGRRR